MEKRFLVINLKKIILYSGQNGKSFYELISNNEAYFDSVSKFPYKVCLHWNFVKILAMKFGVRFGIDFDIRLDYW